MVLLSGGIDSTTLLHYARGRLKVPCVYAVSFHYGQKHARELEMARWQARAAGVIEHREINISFYAQLVAGASALTDSAIDVPNLADIDKNQRSQPITYAPHRNMIFLALAAGYAEARGTRDVFYGAQTQDAYGYWDCTRDFVAGINDVLRLNRKEPVTVRAPFAGKRKSEVLKIGIELAVDYSHTWTCYRGESKACGTCPSCCERIAAFHEIGMEDVCGYS